MKRALKIFSISLFVFLCGLSLATADQVKIVATAGLNGSISPSGEIFIERGGSIRFNLLPNSGYEVKELFLNGAPLGFPNSYLLETFDLGNIGAGGESTISFRVEFQPIPLFSITATAGPHGAINPSGTFTARVGDDLSFQFLPETGYEVAEVFIDGEPQGVAGAPAIFIGSAGITGDMTICVEFRLVATANFNVKATAGPNGLVNPSGVFTAPKGTWITFNFIPNDCFVVKDVFINGQSQNMAGASSLTLAVENDINLFVEFGPKYFIVKAMADANGAISPAGELLAACGDNYGFSIEAEIGFMIADVLVDGESVGAVTSYDMNDIRANHTIEALFIERPPAPSTVSMEAGEIILDGVPIRISFKGEFRRPIVVAKVSSNNDPDPCFVRVHGVDKFGLNISLGEFDYQDGVHAPEKVSYLVVEQGNFTLPNGAIIKAGTTTLKAGIEKQIKFPRKDGFTTMPIVLASVGAKNGNYIGRISDVNAAGFKMKVQGQELIPSGKKIKPSKEKVYYIAIEPSIGQNGDLVFEAGFANIGSQPANVNFGSFFGPPVFLADMNSAVEGDTSWVRILFKDSTFAEIFVQEEISQDMEVDHTQERIGFFAVRE